MNTEIVVALIGLLGVIVSVLATSKATQHKIDTENQVQNQKIDQLAKDVQTVKKELTDKIDDDRELQDTKIAHICENIEILKTDVKEHNHYAKLFSETVPVIQERQNVANHRIDDLEFDIKKLRDEK